MNIVNKRPQKTADASAARGSAPSELVKLSILAVAGIIAVIAGVTITVDVVVKHIPYEMEKKLFSDLYPAKMMEDVTRKESDALDRPQEILDKLTNQASVPPLDYNIFVMQDAQPNAFAFPGGGIALTEGLLNKLEKEVALAFVIGHELGHFKHRDHLRGLGRAIGFSITFSILFGNSLNNKHLLRIANKAIQRQYSRRQEIKADRFGVKLVYSAYGKTKGVTKLFEILKQQGVPSWGYMFATHPSPEKRIERLQAYSAKIQD